MTVLLGDIRKRLADQIRSGTTRQANVFDHPLSEGSNIAYPRITIFPDSDYIQYETTENSDGREVRLVVAVEVRSNDAASFVKIMDDFFDPNSDGSVVAAINADPTLDGLVSAVIVQSASIDPAFGGTLSALVMVD